MAHTLQTHSLPTLRMRCRESGAGGGAGCFHDRFTMSLTALQNLASLEGFQDLTHIQFFYFNHSLLHHPRRPTVSHANSPCPPLLLCPASNLRLSVIPNKTRQRNRFDTNSFPTSQSIYHLWKPLLATIQELSIALTTLNENSSSSHASKPKAAWGCEQPEKSLANTANQLGDSPGQEICIGKGTRSVGSYFPFSQSLPEQHWMSLNLFVHARYYKSSASVHSRFLIKPDIMQWERSQNSLKEPSRTKVLRRSRLIPSLDPSLNASTVERFPADPRGAPCL